MRVLLKTNGRSACDRFCVPRVRSTMQITVPEIVPITTEHLVILVFVVEAKGRGVPNDLAKLLIHRVRRNRRDRDCKTSIPGSNQGGASSSFNNLQGSKSGLEGER